jgi:hypothetical protein
MDIERVGQEARLRERGRERVEALTFGAVSGGNDGHIGRNYDGTSVCRLRGFGS